MKKAPARLLHAARLGCMVLIAVVSGPVAAEGPWTPGAAMPTARSEIAATVLDGKIYVAGGLTTLGTTAAFEVYDPAADAWRTLAPLPVTLHHAGLAAAGGRIYVTGGYDNIFFETNVRGAWVYHPGTDSWIAVADMPAPRAAHAMANIDGVLYVVGGVGPDATALFTYDPASDHWDATRAPLPTAREHLAVAVVDGALHVIGGRWRGKGNLATVEIYDPETDSWTRGRDMPTPRGGLTAAALAGRIHVTGGEAFSPHQTFGQHEVYDPATDGWLKLPDLPTPRHGLSSAIVGGRWYVIGGATKAGSLSFISFSDVVEIFDPAAAGGE